MARKFAFSNALLHFARTEGPRGFVWKYLLTYLAVWTVYFAIYMYFLWPLLSVYILMIQDLAAGGTGDPEQYAEQLTEQMLGMFGGILLLLPLGLVVWSVFESAIQRRYIRDEGFSLRFGSDELRMMAVGLCWFLFLMLAYLVFILFVGGIAAAIGAAISQGAAIGIAMLLALVGGFVWLWVTIRLSAAGALTIQDRRIRFFDSWAVTKGRFWPMLGAFLLFIIAYYVAAIIAYMILAMGMVGVIISNAEVMDAAANDNPEAMMSLFFSPAMLIPAVITLVAMLLIYGFFQYAWAGPAALAAKTDPRTGGMRNIDEEFA